MSGSEHLFPRRPLKALRTRLHLITRLAYEIRQHVLENRQMLLERLDSLADRIEHLAATTAPDADDAGAPSSSVPEWEYVPEGWAREARGAGDGWDVESVARMYAQRWPAFIETLQGTGPVGALHVVQIGGTIPREELNSHNMAMVFAYALALSARRADTLSVLDWGGALGHYHALARVLVPEVELDYHCRELPAVCRQGRQISPEVTFHESDSCLEQRYGLVLASGSIQYVEDWPELLARLARAADRYLLVTKVPSTDAPSFVTLQRAYEYGYDTEYLGWALNREEMRTAGERAGLKLAREFFLSANLEIPNAPGAVDHRGFLFTAK